MFLQAVMILIGRLFFSSFFFFPPSIKFPAL